MKYTLRATTPDGRALLVSQHGYTEYDTNAFVETSDMEGVWIDTDEEITDADFNMLVAPETSLGEWLSTQNWTYDPDDD